MPAFGSVLQLYPPQDGPRGPQILDGFDTPTTDCYFNYLTDTGSNIFVTDLGSLNAWIAAISRPRFASQLNFQVNWSVGGQTINMNAVLRALPEDTDWRLTLRHAYRGRDFTITAAMGSERANRRMWAASSAEIAGVPDDAPDDLSILGLELVPEWRASDSTADYTPLLIRPLGPQPGARVWCDVLSDLADFQSIVITGTGETVAPERTLQIRVAANETFADPDLQIGFPLIRVDGIDTPQVLWHIAGLSTVGRFMDLQLRRAL